MAEGQDKSESQHTHAAKISIDKLADFVAAHWEQLKNPTSRGYASNEAIRKAINNSNSEDINRGLAYLSAHGTNIDDLYQSRLSHALTKTNSITRQTLQ